jgi:hypothetical protein
MGSTHTSSLSRNHGNTKYSQGGCLPAMVPPIRTGELAHDRPASRLQVVDGHRTGRSPRVAPGAQEYPRYSGSPPSSPAVGGRAAPGAVRKPEGVTRGALDRGSRPPNGERSRRCSDRARSRVPPRRVDGMGMSAMWNVSPPNADLSERRGFTQSEGVRPLRAIRPKFVGFTRRFYPVFWASLVCSRRFVRSPRGMPVACWDKDGLPIMGRRLTTIEGDL